MSSSDDHVRSFVQVGRDPSAEGGPVRASVAIGFGSPSGDTGVTRLDLNDVLIRHPQASFLMRASGDAMYEAGIANGDMLLIDRAISPSHGQIVIAVVAEEFVCRRFHRQDGQVRLQATQAGQPEMVAAEGVSMQVWGVVTQVIKTMPV